MKKYLYTILLATLAVMAVSCEKASEGVTGITYYPQFSLDGASLVTVPIGGAYSEPGYTVMEGDEDVTGNVTVTIMDAEGAPVSGIDTGSEGLYTIKYSATNKDGFSASVSRTVVVYREGIDADISGEYSVDMGNSLRPENGQTFQARADAAGYVSECVGITFTKLGGNVYYVNDLFSGWYAQCSNYGASYYMAGYVALNPDNTLSLIYSHVNGWGDGLDGFYPGTSADPEAGTVFIDLLYASAIHLQIYLNKSE